MHTEYFSFEVSLFLKRSKGSQKQVIKIYKSPLNQKLQKNYLHFNLCDKIITELKKRLQPFFVLPDLLWTYIAPKTISS